MTPEHIELHRAKFEGLLLATNKWSVQNFHRPGSEYCDWELRAMFKGYLMCAENLEVELTNIEVCFGKRPFSYVRVDQLIEKLESQGIKVKE